MPWKVDQIMDQRTKFAQEAIHSDNFALLCERYKISRPTGYKWLERYKQLGASGMEDQSRRPKSHRNELPESVVCEIIKLKIAHSKWGPKKIRELYRRKYSNEDLPSESSFKRVLNKAGLTIKRRRRKVTPSARLHTGYVAESSNDVWTVDFKGWWCGGDGNRIEPLTVRDEFSKKILDVRLLANTKTESVKQCFLQLFKTYGIPKRIRSDNGSPFASNRSLLGLSRFSVWLLAHGIKLERGRPGCPQDNGAHERMHLDIYRDLEIERVGYDQQAFDIWREEFNSIRPHEGLGMQTPDEVYQVCKRSYKGEPEVLEYPGMIERKVQEKSGHISYENEHYKLTSSLAKWTVGIRAKNRTYSEVWFSHQLLGHINHEVRKFEPLQNLEKEININTKKL